MNLGERVSCGKLTPTHIGLVDRKVESIVVTAVEADTIALGGTDLQTTLTSLAGGSVTADWNNISNKPGDNAFLDWTQDQGDINLDANNLPLLNYAPNTLASNGTAGLTNYNFNQARKDKLAGIEDNAQVNVQADWNASSGSAQILNKPDLSVYLTAVPTSITDAIALNTAKVSISTAQSDAIVANTAKVSISTAQRDAIVANTAKVSISTAQSDAIVANTAKPTITTVQGLLSPYALISNVVAKSGATMTGALQVTDAVGGLTTLSPDGTAGFSSNVTIGGNINYVTPTELGRLTGISSSVQGQLDGLTNSLSGAYDELDEKANVNNPVFTGGVKIDYLKTPDIGTGARPSRVYIQNNATNPGLVFSATGDSNRNVWGANTGQLLLQTGVVAMRKHNNQIYITSSGSFVSGTSYLGSDDRIKFNEEDITNGLEVIRLLQPQKYDKILGVVPEGTVTPREAGFIAQQVKLIPELEPYVTEPDGEHEYHSIQYSSIFTYAVSAIKTLDTKVTSQATRILALETRLAAAGL